MGNGAREVQPLLLREVCGLEKQEQEKGAGDTRKVTTVMGLRVVFSPTIHSF